MATQCTDCRKIPQGQSTSLLQTYTEKPPVSSLFWFQGIWQIAWRCTKPFTRAKSAPSTDIHVAILCVFANFDRVTWSCLASASIRVLRFQSLLPPLLSMEKQNINGLTVSRALFPHNNLRCGPQNYPHTLDFRNIISLSQASLTWFESALDFLLYP